MKGLFTVITANNSIQTSSIEAIIQQGLSHLVHRGRHKQYSFFTPVSTDTTLAIAICSSEEQANIHNDERNYIAFDGKLHNTDAIKEKLQIHTILSDAELIFQVYNQLGEKGFSLLEGYFSFIFYDSHQQTLYALRDPFGNRPLFYCQTDHYIAIASEARALYQSIAGVQGFDKSAIVDYLLWGNIAQHPQHFFSNIQTLQPAHQLAYSLQNKTLNIQPYYTLAYRSCLGRFDSYKANEVAVTVKQLLVRGIENHISGRKNIAIGLSGGLDSSSLACCMANMDKDINITAFTVVNEFNEAESIFAEKIVTKTKAKWIKVLCTSQQLLKELETINYYQNIPIFNTSSFAQYKLMESASQQGFTSIIDGQGSDELFAGYIMYFYRFIHELSSEFMCKEWLQECKHLSNAHLTCKQVLFESLKYNLKQQIGQTKAYTCISRKPLLLALNEEAKQSYFHQKKPGKAYKETLNDYLYESYTQDLPHILRWGEHSAARFGMDCLMPFADNKALTEFVFSVPSIYKIHKGYAKFLLRSAMNDIVPDEIRLRTQKLGFYTPEDQWLLQISNGMKQGIEGLPDPEDIIKKSFIIEPWDTLFSSTNQHLKGFLFRCFSYLVWRNTWT